jgi:nucleoside-diphosphate-sugar epimerase
LTSGGAFSIPHDKAELVIGWKPVVQMREGVAKLLAWRAQQEKKTA